MFPVMLATKTRPRPSTLMASIRPVVKVSTKSRAGNGPWRSSAR